MILVKKLEPAESQAKWCRLLLGKIMGWQWIRMGGSGVGAITGREKFLPTALFQLKVRYVDSALPFLSM
jgi:hypothetical protein